MSVTPVQVTVSTSVPTLTLAAGAAGGVAVAGSIDPVNDYLLIYTASATATQGINRNTLLGISSQPLGLTDTQSPTNKTFNNTNAYTSKDTSFTLQNASDTTKQAQFLLSGITTGNKRIYTVPDYNATMATLAGTETFTNKTITSPTISAPTITNATISADTLSGFTVSNTGTIYGISVTTGTIGSAAIAANAIVTAGLADSAVTPAKLLSGAGTTWPFQSWTPTLTNIVLGNGTMVAAYNQTGKKISCRLRFTFGSTSSISGVPIFSLPVTANAEYGNDIYYMQYVSLTAAATSYVGIGRIRSTTQFDVVALNAASTYGGTTALSSTVPGTWTTNDFIVAAWEYEAA